MKKAPEARFIEDEGCPTTRKIYNDILNFDRQPGPSHPLSEKTKRKSEAMKQYLHQYYRDLFQYLKERKER